MDGARTLEQRLGIRPGDGKVSITELRPANLGLVQTAASRLAGPIDQLSLIAGVGFVLAAFFKFYQHQLDPKQRQPVSLALVLLFVAAALIYLPSILTAPPGGFVGTNGAPALRDITPLLTEAKQRNSGRQARLLPDDSATVLRNQLAARGIPGRPSTPRRSSR